MFKKVRRAALRDGAAEQSNFPFPLCQADEHFGTELAKCNIVASNDINEEVRALSGALCPPPPHSNLPPHRQTQVLTSLNDQGHEVDTFGIGTNLVTCQAQPALGMVRRVSERGGRAAMGATFPPPILYRRCTSSSRSTASRASSSARTSPRSRSPAPRRAGGRQGGCSQCRTCLRCPLMQSCAQETYRLIGAEGVPLLDLIIRAGEARPQPGK